MPRKRRMWEDDLKVIFEQNGRIFTFFTAIMIVAVGITLVENPSNWWIALVSIGFFFIVTFLFLNAKVIIKSTISVFTLFFLGSYAFKLGAIADPSGISGSLWMSSIFSVYFINLFISFLRPSNKSRWGTVTLASILQFLIATGLIAGEANPTLTILGTGVFGTLVFTLLYKYGFGTRLRLDEMPLVGTDDSLIEEMYEGVLDAGWGAWLPKKDKSDSIIIWNDSSAYQLTSVFFEQKLGIGGRKRSTELTHKGNPVSNWLLNLVYSKTPFKGTGNADIMLILLDEENKNGNQCKVVGVATPDSRKKIAVGILPAKGFFSSKNYSRLLSTILEEFDEYPTMLTKRQLAILDSHLPDGSTVTDTAESIDDSEQTLKETL